MRTVIFELPLYKMINDFHVLSNEALNFGITVVFNEEGAMVSEIHGKPIRTEYFYTPRELRKYLDGVIDGYCAHRDKKIIPESLFD